MKAPARHKRRRFVDVYKFADGTPTATATARDWERSAKLHEKQANDLMQLSERCLRMAETVRKARR